MDSLEGAAQDKIEVAKKIIGQSHRILFDMVFLMESSPSKSQVSRSDLMVALRHPNFAKLLTGQVIAAFGDRINQTAFLSIIIYKLGSPHKYGADMMFWAILPAVVIGLFAMALIDRWDRQKTLIATDLCRGFVMLCLPVIMFWVDHHYVIYGCVFLIGIFTSIFSPCKLAIMPNIIPQNLLLPANAISSQAGTVASLAVMPLASWIVERWGANYSFLFSAITYIVSASFIWRLQVERVGHTRTKEQAHPIQDFNVGLKYILNSKVVLFYVLFFVATQSLVALFFPTFLKYGTDILGQTVGGICLLFLAVAVGMGVGAVTLGRLGPYAEFYLLPMLAMLGAGVGIYVLSSVYYPWPAGFLLFVIGFCAVMVMVPMDTFLQKFVPDELRGRVFTARGFLVGTAMLISLQPSKAINERYGPLKTFEILGIFACVVAAVSLCAVLFRKKQIKVVS